MDADTPTILLSVKPRFANAIISGTSLSNRRVFPDVWNRSIRLAVFVEPRSMHPRDGGLHPDPASGCEHHLPKVRIRRRGQAS